MYRTEALLDVHDRTHKSLAKALDHCRAFTQELLLQRPEGFGVGGLRDQFYHVIAAEQYWISVIRDRMLAEDRAAEFRDIDSLEAHRAEVAAVTQDYLRSTDLEELNTPRTLTTWQNIDRELMPAQVVMRPLTHAFMHLGQITAICRLLGRPLNGIDLPLEV